MVSAKSDVTTQENIASFLNYCNRDDVKERPCSAKLLGGIGWGGVFSSSLPPAMLLLKISTIKTISDITKSLNLNFFP